MKTKIYFGIILIIAISISAFAGYKYNEYLMIKKFVEYERYKVDEKLKYASEIYKREINNKNNFDEKYKIWQNIYDGAYIRMIKSKDLLNNTGGSNEQEYNQNLNNMTEKERIAFIDELFKGFDNFNYAWEEYMMITKLKPTKK